MIVDVIYLGIVQRLMTEAHRIHAAPMPGKDMVEVSISSDEFRGFLVELGLTKDGLGSLLEIRDNRESLGDVFYDPQKEKVILRFDPTNKDSFRRYCRTHLLSDVLDRVSEMVNAPRDEAYAMVDTYHNLRTKRYDPRAENSLNKRRVERSKRWV